MSKFHYCYSETGNPVGVNVFDVPLLSWICVGLGIIVSLLVVSTPAWWDRLVNTLASYLNPSCLSVISLRCLSVISLPPHTLRLIIGVCLKSCKKSDSGSPELRLQMINQLDSITEET